MEFTNPAQEACYGKVARWMKEMYGEMVTPLEKSPAFVLPLGSSMTYLLVSPWGKDDATITIFAYVVSGAGLTFDLMYALLKENNNFGFGAFSVNENGDILFSHTIVGSWCDKEELRASVRTVAQVADDYDDSIIDQWGGRRAVDVH